MELGCRHRWQLGTTMLEDEQLPQLLLDLPSFFSVEPISLLACSGAHVLALTTDGKVVTWGRGTFDQLGHEDMVSNFKPKHVKSLESLVIIHVSTGWSHSGFVLGYLSLSLMAWKLGLEYYCNDNIVFG